MVCHGPDPIDESPADLTPPSRQDLMMNGNQMEESDEEQNDYVGYEPLAQGPDTAHSDHESSDEENQPSEPQQPVSNIPNIEPMEATLTREVWSTPRPTDTIQMDNDRARQVMLAMANFSLPQTSIPEWAQSMTEEQWKQTLNDRIQGFKSTR